MDAATADVKALNLPAVPTKRGLAERQTTPAPTNPLAAELSMVLQEIGTALNSIIATLGLSKSRAF